MRIFLTGGTGFFGSALIKYLGNYYLPITGSLSLHVLSRSPNTFLRNNPHLNELPWLDFRIGNILQIDTIPSLSSYDYIIHAAADSTKGTTLSDIDRFEQILIGTRNLLDRMEPAGQTRLLFISSGAVYGNGSSTNLPLAEELVDANRLCYVASPYAFGKLAAERLCQYYSKVHNLDYTVARCFSFVGPSLPLRAHFAIGNFIYDALQNKDIIIKGDGTGIRSYMYEDDLARWLIEILINGKHGEAYNVGSDIPISIRDLACLIRDNICPSSDVIIQNDPSVPSTIYIPDTNKAATKLGLELSLSLLDSVIATAKAHVE